MLKSILDRGTTLAVVLLAGFLYHHVHTSGDVTPVAPTPAPAPVVPTPPVVATPALVLSAQDYAAKFGPNFKSVGERVGSGELATVDAILEAFRANSTPFNQALADAIKNASSANGSISDKDGLAKVFRDVAAAMGSK